MNRFEWAEARSLADPVLREAVAVAQAMRPRGDRAADSGTILKAGGIDVVDLMKEGLLAPRRVVNLRAIPGLNRIAEGGDGGLRIGAMATLAQVAAHPAVRARYRALADATGQAASPQLRNMATLGGNLLQRPRCWYFRSAHHDCARKGGATCFAFAGENAYHALFGHTGCAMVHPSTPATALVAFDARLELAGAAGGPRVVPLERFLVAPARDLTRENDLQPGEVLTAVVLPPAPGIRSAHLRQGELDSFDWPIADVAAVLDLAPDGICRRAAIVLGAAAPVPYRAVAAERALVGQRVGESAARAAARTALAGARPLSGNAYKVAVFEALVHRTLLAASQGGSP